MVGFEGVFDFGSGAVVFPEVGVAAVGEEGLGWDGGGFGLGGRGGGRILGRRLWFWRGRRGGGVLYGGFFFEKVPQTGVEVTKGIIVAIGIFAFAPKPAHWHEV